jgi:hypothetical protein
MKTAIRVTLRLGLLGALGATLFWCAVPEGAQSPPGPITSTPSQAPPPSATKAPEPQVAPRTTILGAWKLNRDDSDNQHKQDSNSSGGGGGGRRGGYGGGPRVGVGYPGGHGGYGGGRGQSDEDRQKMRELFSPPSSMTLAMTGAEVDLMDDQSRKRAFMTDGRKLQKSKDPNYQEIAAKFDGNRLITDEKTPRGDKMSRTFELSEDGRQLYETLRVNNSRTNYSQVIRYVYDATDQARP